MLLELLPKSIISGSQALRPATEQDSGTAIPEHCPTTAPTPRVAGKIWEQCDDSGPSVLNRFLEAESVTSFSTFESFKSTATSSDDAGRNADARNDDPACNLRSISFTGNESDDGASSRSSSESIIDVDGSAQVAVQRLSLVLPRSAAGMLDRLQARRSEGDANGRWEWGDLSALDFRGTEHRRAL